jgi:sugar phosphate isomerase/epimerase
MKLGICTAPEKAHFVKEAGYDFYEYQVFKVHDAAEEQFAQWLALQEEAGIRCEAMNCMLPASLAVTGPKADLAIVRPYLEKVIPRCAKMGCETIVFGSAWSRNMPEGFSDKQKAFAQLVDYLHMASDICGERGIAIAIEPLGATVTNIVTFVAEGNYLCRLADRKNVRLLVDLFALSINMESNEEIVAYAPMLEHLHFCAFNRRYPRLDDGCDYAPFFDAVRRSGFDKRMSVEATHNGDELADMREAMAVFCKYLGR